MDKAGNGVLNTDYLPSDEEIVGFDGVPSNDAGILLALVHNRRTDLYYKRSLRRSSESGFYNKEQIDDLAKRRRLTLLPQPVKPFPGAVAVYATIEFTDTAEQYLPDDVDPQLLPTGISVGFSTRDRAVSWLEQQSARILANADVLLEEYYFNQVNEQPSEASDASIPSKAYHFTELALSAAFNPVLRSQVYLEMGLSLTLSKQDQALDNLFAFSVSQEFKNWQWEDFMTRLKRRGDAKQIRALYDARTSMANEKMSVGMPAQVRLRKRFHKDLAIISSIAGNERVLRASTLAQGYHTELLGQEEWALLEKRLESFIQKRGLLTHYTLDLDYLPLFVSDPMSYVASDGIKVTESGIRVDSISLRRESNSLKGIALGPATRVFATRVFVKAA